MRLRQVPTIKHGASSKSCTSLWCANFTAAASGKTKCAASWLGCSRETVVATLCSRLRRVGRNL
jgi:hypothetical protein